MSFDNTDPNPFGIPLDGLAIALSATSLKVRRVENSLIINNDALTTVMAVLPPPARVIDDGQIRGVLTVETRLPQDFVDIFCQPGLMSSINAQATLGAITQRGDEFYVGSRLTVYDDEDAWNIQAPLVLYATIGAAEAIIGAARRALKKAPFNSSESHWQAEDFAVAERYLSNVCMCSAGGNSLTAEFRLGDDTGTTILGDRNTALWQMRADQPHPDVGGGLFCLLEMPHSLAGDDDAHRAVCELNQLEMASEDIPPHFGAWCIGGLGRNPAYVSFLPNQLHEQFGIALNASVWALHRAEWASLALARLSQRDRFH